MLIISFSVNTGPPIDDTGSRLTAFEQQHFDAILWGAWLQAIGPVFIVLFAFTIVRLADGMTRVTGWMTLFGAATLMIVNLVEIVGYIGAPHTSPATMADISFVLIRATQHLYFIIGCSYASIAGCTCGATTIRDRRDEWIQAGLFARLKQIARESYDWIVGLVLPGWANFVRT
jgi:hypothetical protein